MSLPGRLIDADGVRIFVHEAGAPGREPPVVLVHGWSVSHWMWRDVIHGLVAAGRQVIALDLPGAGESDRPAPSKQSYAPDALAVVLWRVLDLLGVRRAALVGHSMGGAVVIHAARQQAGRVAGLIVIDGALAMPRLPAATQVLRVPIVGTMALRAGSTRTLVGHFMRTELYRDPSVVTPAWVEHVWERMHRPGGIEALHAAFLALLDAAPTRAALAQVLASGLAPHLVWGEGDRLFPVAVPRALCDEHPGLTLDVIAHAGHSPPEERAAATTRVILARLGGHAPAPEVLAAPPEALP